MKAWTMSARLSSAAFQVVTTHYYLYLLLPTTYYDGTVMYRGDIVFIFSDPTQCFLRVAPETSLAYVLNYSCPVLFAH
jgi:hypothetical protein